MNLEVADFVGRKRAAEKPIILVGKIFNVAENSPSGGSWLQMRLDDEVFGWEIVVLEGPHLKIEAEGDRAVVAGTWEGSMATYLTLGGVREDPRIEIFWGQIVYDPKRSVLWGY